MFLISRKVLKSLRYTRRGAKVSWSRWLVSHRATDIA